MRRRVEMLRDEMRTAVRDLDAARLDGRDAERALRAVAEMERLAGAAKTLLTSRVRQCSTWTRDGHRTFEEWLAQVSGSGLGEAFTTAETAARLDDLPATEDALRAGKLSRVQAAEVTAAATADPGSEDRLLHLAETGTVKRLKDRAKHVKAAVRGDEHERHQRIHAGRHVRSWEDHDGGHLHFQSTAEDLAVVKNAIEAYVPAIFDAARTRGERESSGAYRADALVAMASEALGATGTETKKRLPRAELRLRMDFPAFRGTTEPGETCEIPGIGPVPVDVARQLVPDALLDLIVTQGQDVRAIVTHSRTVARAVQVALEERYPTCRKWDCDATAHLENDHTVEYSRSGHTKYEELVRWCPHHHDLRHHGYTPVQLDDGTWDLKPPDLDERAPPDAS